MSRSPEMERLERLEDEALARRAGQSVEFDPYRAAPAAPGDLFVLSPYLEGTADGVEWAILARDPGDDRRLLAVAADTHPLLGSADLGVRAEEACGPLSLRCGVEVWLDAEALRPAERSGCLAPEVVARALEKRAALADGPAAAGGELAREVDHEAEYRLWMNELAAARDRLAHSPAGASTPHPPAPVASSPGSSAPGRPPWAHPLALAPAATLLLGLGLAGGLLWRGDRPPPAADGDAVLLNPPFAWLLPQQRVRGPVDTVVVAPAQPFLWLVLDRGGRTPASEYRLEIRRRGEPEAVWSGVVTPPTGSELTLALPRPVLADGVYEFRLFDPRGEPVEEGVYAVEVRTASPDAAQRQSP